MWPIYWIKVGRINYGVFTQEGVHICIWEQRVVGKIIHTGRSSGALWVNLHRNVDRKISILALPPPTEMHAWKRSTLTHFNKIILNTKLNYNKHAFLGGWLGSKNRLWHHTHLNKTLIVDDRQTQQFHAYQKLKNLTIPFEKFYFYNVCRILKTAKKRGTKVTWKLEVT